uniref:Formylmethanofuran dehydrogenase subunit E region n=1 Tax=uncultured organism TaxID=155900 RepID=M1QAS8_9ZZZZ|nr:formylmethanofuran dehydrogenase subunit E region [uncultured organism]
MNNKKTLKKLANFHGHLGPYIIVGYKMGILANEKLGKNPFDKKATAKTGRETPLSCIIDGIQFASGCTLGKGNVSIEQEKKPEATFHNQNKKLETKLKPNIHEKIKSADEDQLEETAREIFKQKPKDILELQITSRS